MKIAATVSRYLLGLLFTVIGLNGFLNFIPQPPPANPVALQFLSAMSGSHYIAVVFLVQIIGGILLLSGRFVPLALAILGPVVVNILNYHITMDPGGISRGLLATILWMIVFLRHRSSFAQIFQPHPPEETAATLKSPQDRVGINGNLASDDQKHLEGLSRSTEASSGSKAGYRV